MRKFAFIPASNEPSQFIDFVPLLARAFVTIELVLLYLTNEFIRLYGECREGIKLQWRLFSMDRSGAQTIYPCALAHLALLRYKLDAPLLAAGLLTLTPFERRLPCEGQLPHLNI